MGVGDGINVADMYLLGWGVNGEARSGVWGCLHGKRSWWGILLGSKASSFPKVYG